MSLLNTAAKIFMEKVGANSDSFDIASVVSSLSQLLPTQGGELDLSAIIGQLQTSGLGAMAMSWLGNEENKGVSTQQILGLFGQDKVQNFASSLNLDENAALKGLSGLIPELIDKQSDAGSLLGNAKGILGSFLK